MTALASMQISNPWLENFRASPTSALDDLLRGAARVPPYERATPSEILKRLFGILPTNDPELRLLDESLRAWLERRWREGNATHREAYGLPRFVTEFMDALAVVWLLRLPSCGVWIQDNYLALARWAAPLRLSGAWNLPRALANAAALTQADARLRFCWYRMCAEAARPSQRHMIDPALAGLSNLPGTAGHGASPELIGGLARFGAGLAPIPKDQVDFLRRWRALKVRFPRVPKTWHALWYEVLADSRFGNKPFRQWLLDSDPSLARQLLHAPKGALPPKQQFDSVLRRLKAGERDAKILAEVTALLGSYERYAEVTGDAYFLVTSANNLGKEIIAWAPGHALAWAREALRWSPSNGPSWSLRARALVRLGRKDLAQTVLWEAVRRLPNDGHTRTQLSLLLEEEGRLIEAEALLREALAVDSGNPGVKVELAQLLSRTDRGSEAEELLRRSAEDLPHNQIVLYTLACLLISWERLGAAADQRNLYVERFGEDRLSAELNRLLAAGALGSDEVRQRLAVRHAGEEKKAPLAVADASVADREAASEQRAGEALRSAANVGHADLLFRVGAVVEARARLEDALGKHEDDLYARVVWALHDPAQRTDLAARYRQSFGVLAPHLAAADTSTTTVIWDRLRDEFPERRPLIEFTRLIRSGPDDAAAQRLSDWLREGSDSDSEDAFLRARVRELVARDGRFDANSVDQRGTLDAAIRREVDLGDLVLDEAA